VIPRRTSMAVPPPAVGLYTHSVSVTKTSQLMLYREIIAVCSEIHTKHINTLCGQNVELLNVKLAVHKLSIGLYRMKCVLVIRHSASSRPLD